MADGTDGWRIEHSDSGFVALYLPDTDQPDNVGSQRGPFDTLGEAVEFAGSNYTARGVVQR